MVRNQLAMLSAFLRLPPSAPHGTNHAAYAMSCAIARLGIFGMHTSYCDDAAGLRRGDSYRMHRYAPPEGARVALEEKSELVLATGRYDAVYALGNEWIDYLPHGLRPRDDWSPVIVEVDIAHHSRQWQNAFVGAATGAIRPTDGFIFKSLAAQKTFRETWDVWRSSFGVRSPPPPTLVSYNPIDAQENRSDERLRLPTRAALGISASAPVFLCFSRLEPYFKGDARALVLHWRKVVERIPEATLVLAGAVPDDARHYPGQLLTAARRAGVANRVVLVGNPYEQFANARTALMSMADVFVHLTTGLEETCPLVVLEAMSHSLPVIATRWSALPEVIVDGETGWLVDAHVFDVPDGIRSAFLARNPVTLAGETSALAAVDWPRLVELVVAAAGNPQKRQAMGEAARATVVRHHDARAKALERLEFVRALSREASAVPVEARLASSPLVDVGRVLRNQAGKCVSARARFTLEEPKAQNLLPHGTAEVKRVLYAKVVESLAATDLPLSLLELARAIAVPGAESAAVTPDDFFLSEPGRAMQQLLASMMAHGVVSIVDA